MAKMENRNQFRRTARFTLVELLVVIIIIVILAGLLLPALSRSRAKARYISCISNYKQMSLGYSMYRNDFKGIPPSGRIMGKSDVVSIRRPYGYDDGRGGGPEIYGLPSALHPYLTPGANIWRCPSAKPTIQVGYYANVKKLNDLSHGYGMEPSNADPSVSIRAIPRNFHLREIGGIQVVGENNYREGALKTGVWGSVLNDSGPALDPREFGHSGAVSGQYTGTSTDIHMTADGTVILAGIWAKWHTGKYEGRQLF